MQLSIEIIGRRCDAESYPGLDISLQAVLLMSAPFESTHLVLGSTTAETYFVYEPG
jgi:hypothetical protein